MIPWISLHFHGKRLCDFAFLPIPFAVRNIENSRMLFALDGGGSHGVCFLQEAMISTNAVASNDWKVHEGTLPFCFMYMLVGGGFPLLL